MLHGDIFHRRDTGSLIWITDSPQRFLSGEVVGAEARGYQDAVDFGLEAGVEVGEGGGGDVVVGEVDAGEGVG